MLIVAAFLPALSLHCFFSPFLFASSICLFVYTGSSLQTCTKHNGQDSTALVGGHRATIPQHPKITYASVHTQVTPRLATWQALLSAAGLVPYAW